MPPKSFAATKAQRRALERLAYADRQYRRWGAERLDAARAAHHLGVPWSETGHYVPTRTVKRLLNGKAVRNSPDRGLEARPPVHQ